MANPKTGIFIIGLLKGVFETTREKNGKTYVNRFMGIVTGEYKDRYNETQENILEISIDESQYRDLLKADLSGQVVSVPVMQIARGGQTNGRNWAFTSTFLPKESFPEVFKQPLAKAS